MTQYTNAAIENFGKEIMNNFSVMVRNMFGDAAVRDEQLASLGEEFQSYIEDDEKLFDLLKLYAYREATERRPLANAVCKMFLMEKVFKKA